MQQKKQPLRFRTKLTRFVIKLGIIFAILLCILLLLINFLLPHYIDSYRPSLEAFLSSKINAPVSISQLNIQRDGLLPKIEITDFRIDNSDGSQGLQVEKIDASLSIKALLSGKIRFSDININTPQLYIQRHEDNTLWIAGINITAIKNRNLNPASTSAPTTIPPGILWLIHQYNITLKNGLVQWDDNTNTASPIRLTNITASLQSSNYNHKIIIEATPPTEFGERFTFEASLDEPIYKPADDINNWSAEINSSFPRIDVNNIYRHTPLPVEKIQGYGLVKGHAQYKEGKLIDSQLTLSIPDFEITTKAGLPPIQFKDFNSTLNTTWENNTLHLQSDDLSFNYISSLEGQPQQYTWLNKNIDLTWKFDDNNNLVGGAIKLANIDLETLAYIALGLPLPEPAQQALADMHAQGTVDDLNIQWQGTIKALDTYSIKGQLSNLHAIAGIAPPIPEGKKIAIGRPGLNNLNIHFDINEQGGTLQLAMTDGTITIPGLFSQPELQVSSIEGTAYLEHLGTGQIKINAQKLNIITPDLELNSHLTWISPDPNDASDIAGYFTMDGQLINGQITSVSRYLPLSIQPKVRTYLQAALISGDIPSAKVTIHGPLADFPYHLKNTGIFLIEGTTKNATYAFAPPVVQPKSQAPWPVLDHINGDIEITGKGLVIRNASGNIQNASSIQFTSNEISIPNWGIQDTHVLISANINGPANTLLKTINDSPIGQNLLKDLLIFAHVSGNISTELSLDLSLDRMAQSTVQGNIFLENNSMSLWPFLPVLQNTKGNLSFTETGFTATEINAQTLGGTVQGKVHLDLKKGLSIDLKGTLTGQGIFSDPNWGHQLLPDLKWLNGESSYTFKAATENGQQFMRWESTLEGMEVLLPQPLYKSAQTSYPLQISLIPIHTGANQYLPLQLQIQAQQTSNDLPQFQANYVLNKNKNTVEITQGTIGINATPAMPITGTSAQINIDQLNVTAWQEFLANLPEPETEDPNRLSSSNLILPIWWPQTTSAKIDELRIGERFVAHDTQLTIRRQYDNWEAEINSSEIIGHLRWNTRTAASPSLLNANFSRFWLPPLLNAEERAQQPSPDQSARTKLFMLLPNTKLSIDDLRLGDKKLGAMQLDGQIDTTVTPKRWRIQHLEISNDAATLTAQGYWANTLIPTTALELQINLRNTGELITELGYEKILAQASGKISGVLRWQDLPYAFDTKTLSGNLDLDLKKGEVLLADPGAGRLLSVISLQALPSRVSLDFRDIFNKGLAFDTLKGQLIFNQGELEVNQLNLFGISAEVGVNGQINLINETQDLQVIVLPHIDAIPVSILLTTINPPAGIGSLLAQLALKGPIQKASTRTYHISGSWSDPQVTTIKENTLPLNEKAP